VILQLVFAIEHGVDLFNEANRIFLKRWITILNDWLLGRKVGEINPLGSVLESNFSSADIQELINIAQDYGFSLNEDT